jgi:hypothetical protein
LSDVIEIGGSLDEWDAAKPESKFSVLKRKFGLKVAAASVGGAGLVSAVSADTINWTPMIEMMEGVASFFPSIGTMVMAIIPTLLLLAVVAFVLGFFDGILDAIKGALKIIK